MPERDDDHLTAATRLLAKRREMAEVERALSAQKEVQILLCVTIGCCVECGFDISSWSTAVISHGSNYDNLRIQ